MPIYEVADLEATLQALAARGRQRQGAAFEIPNGPCHVGVLSGNQFAIFQDIVGVMEGAYADPTNRHADEREITTVRRSLMKLGLQVVAFNWPGSPATRAAR